MKRKKRISRVVIVLILSAIISTSLSMWFLTKERVLVESSSMMHGEAPGWDVLDTGDLAEVIEYSGEDDVVTYFEGKERDYKTCGDYGDVIIYWKNGDESTTPVIHRVILLLEFDKEATDASTDNRTYFNIPELGLYNLTGQFVVAEQFKTFYPDEPNGPLIIDLDKIYQNMESDPHSGYLTKGDYNPLTGIDQYTNSEPVKFEWIQGRAKAIDSVVAYILGAIIFVSLTLVIVGILILVIKRTLKKKGKWKDPESTPMSDTPPLN